MRKKMKDKHFPNLMKGINLQNQDAQGTPSTGNRRELHYGIS